MHRVAVLGIAGGSASGKTTVCRKILDALAGEPIALLDHDAYYKDLGHLSLDERRLVNFDHPDAFDNDLLVAHIDALCAGQVVRKPVYSFKEYTRTGQTVEVKPGRILIVEGILVLATPELRKRMDVKIYAAADDDIRFIRRLTRDVKERGRSIDDVVKQYLGTVRPMHLAFVEPSKRYADVVIPSERPNDIAISVVVSAIRERLHVG